MRIALLSTSDTDLLSARASGAPYAWANPANLGTPSEQLVAGRVGEVLGELAAARVRATEAAGWVMDAYLLRAVG